MRECVRACVRSKEKRTVPYNLPLLFIATNSSLLTPNKLITPRSTAEISNRPAHAHAHTHIVRGEQCQRPTASGRGEGRKGEDKVAA